MDDGALDGAPIGVLVSDEVDRRFGARIDAAADQAGVRVRRWTAPSSATELASIDVALFSRDLYEGSSLRTPGPLSNAFFALVDAAPNLRWLHVCTTGLDLPQYRASLARGISVTGSSGVTAEPIAQSVLAAVLAHSRGFAHWLGAQRDHAWRPLLGAQRPREIAGQRVVVVGTGPIGSAIARLLRGVGFHTVAVRWRAEPAAAFDETYTVDALDGLLATCDWLVLACPLTEATRGLIDTRRLALLPATACLANVARGELVDEAALAERLCAGRLAGAFLDVFAQEPLPPASPLWALPNVWITPHNCAASQGHEARVVDKFVERLVPWLGAQNNRQALASRTIAPNRDCSNAS